MKFAVAWVDPGLDADAVTPWPADASETATLAVGSHAGPGLLRWLAQARIGSLLLVARPAHHRALGYVANVVTGARREVLVATRTTSSGAVAALTHGVLLAGLDAEPSTKIAVFDAMMAAPWSGAWLRSVTAVDRPAPRMRQYLRSLFPGGPRFLVLNGPEPAIHAAGAPVPGAPTRGDLLVACDDPEVPEPLTAAFPGLQVVRLPVPAPIKPIYGSHGYEFVIVDRSLPAPPPAGMACRVCGQPRYHRACPFCHVVSPRSDLQ